jgi:hypothetical protein
LTELAQSRAVDIQGVREDIAPAATPVHPAIRRTQRIQKIHPERCMLQQAGIEHPFYEMASVENEDIVDEIRLMLSSLVHFPERTRHVLLSIVCELMGRNGAMRMRDAFFVRKRPTSKKRMPSFFLRRSGKKAVSLGSKSS